MPGSFAIGRIRVPLFGVFATAGLVTALLCGERTAAKAGVDRDKLWDAGIVAVVVAFVASRVLLVLENFSVFRAMPLLVLALPSLTYGGVLATAVVMLGYLRWKGVPVLGAMDAWAPCAAVLAAFLQLGHFFEGTDAGLPTTLPWGVITPGDTVMGRVQPVQLYGMVAALGLAWFLFRRLGRGARGQVASLGLMMGGAAAFLLDMLRQPLDSQSSLPLDTSQFVALGAMLAGLGLFASRAMNDVKRPKRKEMTREEVADLLELFFSDKPEPKNFNTYEALTYEHFTDPVLIGVQRRFQDLPVEFPIKKPQRGYCNHDGSLTMLEVARQLRNNANKMESE